MTIPSQLTESFIVSTLRAAGCVFAEDEAALLIAAAASSEDLDAMIARRVAGFPLEHILGWVDFFGLRVAVDPGVFVPRRRTELLVREALARVSPSDVVVDLCCGCGALGAAVAASVPGLQVYAGDIDPAAVECARRNLSRAGAQVVLGDLFDPFPQGLRGRVDVILCNAPYVPTDKIRMMPPEARLHEPRVTLDGGLDGLDVQRRVAAEAVNWLSPGGHLLVEASEDQAPLAAEIFASGGLEPLIVASEELDAVAVIGTKPA
jgi:release factor glutamine methyltransferase